MQCLLKFTGPSVLEDSLHPRQIYSREKPGCESSVAYFPNKRKLLITDCYGSKLNTISHLGKKRETIKHLISLALPQKCMFQKANTTQSKHKEKISACTHIPLKYMYAGLNYAVKPLRKHLALHHGYKLLSSHRQFAYHRNTSGLSVKQMHTFCIIPAIN